VLIALHAIARAAARPPHQSFSGNRSAYTRYARRKARSRIKRSPLSPPVMRLRPPAPPTLGRRGAYCPASGSAACQSCGGLRLGCHVVGVSASRSGPMMRSHARTKSTRVRRTRRYPPGAEGRSREHSSLGVGAPSKVIPGAAERLTDLGPRRPVRRPAPKQEARRRKVGRSGMRRSGRARVDGNAP